MSGSATRIRVRYAETDKMGVVHHSNYFVWFELGRSELLRSRGWTYREMEETGVMLPVIEASCAYLQPSRYDDEVEVRARAEVLSPVRLAFDYEIVRLPEATVLARGRTVHAAISRAGKPCRLPDRARTLLS
jgi:acyl-CoA thioester hydrolase